MKYREVVMTPSICNHHSCDVCGGSFEHEEKVWEYKVDGEKKVAHKKCCVEIKPKGDKR